MHWLDTNSPISVIKTVIPRFRKHFPPFDQRINVEDWVPQNLTDEHKARFIFFTTSVDYGMKSTILYKGFLQLIKDIPTFLNLEYVVKTDTEKLALTLKNYLHLRWPNNAARYFKYNTNLLKNLYNGNVLNIFKKSKAKEVIQSLKQFKGFGDKTTFLAFRATANTLELKYPDINQLQMPIDRHKLRATHKWNFINDSDYKKKNLKKVSQLWIKACQKTGVSWLEFDRAFWILARSIR